MPSLFSTISETLLTKTIRRNLVDQLHGEIKFESQIQKGTTVSVTIPVASELSWNDVQGRLNPGHLSKEESEAEDVVHSVKKLASHHKVSLVKLSSSSSINLDLMAQILREWFGFEVSMSMSAHIDGGIIILEDTEVRIPWQETIGSRDAYVFLVSGKIFKRPSLELSVENGLAGRIEWPIGPYRLAKTIWQGMHRVHHAQVEQVKQNGINGINGITKQPTPMPMRLAEPKVDPSLRILAVDDNEVNLQILNRFISKFTDTKTTLARNGLEALQAFQQSPDRFDLVLMDISMPVMDGFESTRQIRKWEQDQRKNNNTGKNAHIVALTGLASEEDRAEAKGAGIDDYMTKPARLADIRSMIEQVRAAI